MSTMDYFLKMHELAKRLGSTSTMPSYQKKVEFKKVNLKEEIEKKEMNNGKTD